MVLVNDDIACTKIVISHVTPEFQAVEILVCFLVSLPLGIAFSVYLQL
jgi:hypothetical protein